MTGRRKQNFHDEVEQNKLVKFSANSAAYEPNILCSVHSTFCNRPDLKLKLQAKATELLIESTKPSFLCHLLAHCSLGRTVVSVLRISTQEEDNKFTLLEKHTLECLKCYVSCSKSDCIVLDNGRWRTLTDLVENILNSWSCQYDLLDCFFSSFADWIGSEGLKVNMVLVKPTSSIICDHFLTTSPELDISGLKLDLWRRTVFVCQVSLTVFFRDWNERPKLVVEVQLGQIYRTWMGQIYRTWIVRNQLEIQETLKQLSDLWSKKTGTSSGCSTYSTSKVALKPGSYSSHMASTSAGRSYVNVPPRVAKASLEKPEVYNSSFIHMIRPFANDCKGIRMSSVSDKNAILNQNLQISLAKYPRLHLPSASNDTAVACRLNVKDCTGDVGNKGYFIKEVMYHDQLMPGNWEQAVLTKSQSAIGKLITSWEDQVIFMKRFFQELEQFLKSLNLTMIVTPQQKLLILKVPMENWPRLEVNFHASWKIRPLIQVQMVQTGQEVTDLTFMCKTISHVHSMLAKLKCLAEKPQPIEIVTTVPNDTSSDQQLYAQLENILRGSRDMSLVSVRRFQQEVPRLRKMLANMQQVDVEVGKSDFRIQASSGLYKLKIILTMADKDTHMKWAMELNGPEQNIRRSHCFLWDEKNFAENIGSCLSHFCSQVEVLVVKEEKIVVEVVEEEREIKEEETGETSQKENDLWTRIENLKQEIDS